MTDNINSTAIENVNAAETDIAHHKDDNLKSLLEFIKVELEALDKAQLSERDKRSDERDQKRISRANQGTATTLYANGNSNPQCIFCKSASHSTKNCTSNMSVEQRKQLLRQESRCFRCGNKNHSSKFCRAQWVKCNGCSGRHLTPMCEQAKASEKNLRMSDRSDIKKQGGNSSVTGAQAALSNSLAGTATLNTISAEQIDIFLQTAKAVVSDVTNSERGLSRLVMDNGSQRTYISEKLANFLKLSASGIEKMRIVAFGDKNTHRQPTDFKSVQLNIKGQYSGKTKTITAIVVPKICIGVLPVPEIRSEKLKYFKLKLADTNISGENLVDGINLLIGQDHFWQFTTTESKRISERLAAVKTLFGWTIQGCSSNLAVDSCVLNISDSVGQLSISLIFGA
ncbi:uncharacterized protein LOC118734774 [Rhagoletis pomonella]|uniref:uncharacterized protein LOC118734774 n=1 Tax=Rhagoletis pomonella TaxID=28610 RepID=UPI00177BE864|nr:uncharacterized protein LOC118734774 [Rhagoletis pomonella]